MALPAPRNPTLSTLFWSFFKVGAFTFGGGLAMLPVMQREIVDRQGWQSEQEFVDVLAIAQSSPGAIAINTAIFTGYKLLGGPGVAVAIAGVVLPSFLIITVLAATLTAAEPPPLLTEFFLGIRPAVVALILAAAIGIGKKVLVDRFNIILAAVALGVSLVSNAHPGILIVSAAIFGYLHQQLLSRGGARP
ncbi:MAG: putative chromate transport protein [Firmicutes bacterium]|nr:putative chromate transport protein [Bacillota bacterium]